MFISWKHEVWVFRYWVSILGVWVLKYQIWMHGVWILRYRVWKHGVLGWKHGGMSIEVPDMEIPEHGY